MATTGTLEKLTIISFKNSDLTDVIGTFVAMFNPSTFSVNASNAFDENKQPGKGKADQKLKHREPRTLSLELFFDGTAASPPGEYKGPDFTKLGLSSEGTKTSAIDQLKNDISKEGGTGKNVIKGETVTRLIQAFFDTTYTLKDTTHRPNFLAFVWGTFLFPCVLESANVTYSLFQNDGKPLRAKINISAKEHISESKLNEVLKLKSPDLTQSRTIIAGDTLPNLAKKIYGNENLYMELAKANNLRNYRRLTPGQQLIFPPIEKISSKA